MFSTPRKGKERVCVACGSVCTQGKQLQGGRDPMIGRVFAKYSHVDICEGIICRSCERKLDTIERKCSEYARMCQATAPKNKRCPAGSPLQNTPKRFQIEAPEQKSNTTPSGKQVLYKHLYKESSTDLGTMKSLQERIRRSSVKLPVKDHYDSDKDFAVSFVHAYIVEAVLDYFGMEDVNSTPTKNFPPHMSLSPWEVKQWFTTHFTNIVNQYVNHQENEYANVEEEGEVVVVRLANGQLVNLLTKTQQKDKCDSVKNYAHLALELGLLFKALQDMIHLPDRDRAIRLLKLAMLVFKADNNLSKYAFEVLRLLVHQLCSLSERAAHEEFYAMFVNTKGHIDSHIPVDLCMEHQVRIIKRHLKHMGSKKGEQSVMTRTSALPGITKLVKFFIRQPML